VLLLTNRVGALKARFFTLFPFFFGPMEGAIASRPPWSRYCPRLWVLGNDRKNTITSASVQNEILRRIEVALFDKMRSFEIGKSLNMCVCVFLPGSFRGMGAFYFETENRRDILNTTLMTSNCTIQPLTTGSKHKHHIQLLGTMQMSRQQPE